MTESTECKKHNFVYKDSLTSICKHCSKEVSNGVQEWLENGGLHN